MWHLKTSARACHDDDDLQHLELIRRLNVYIYNIFVYIYVDRAVCAGRACIVTECRDTKFSVLLKNLVGSSLKFPSVCWAVGQARWAYARPYSRVFFVLPCLTKHGHNNSLSQ